MDGSLQPLRASVPSQTEASGSASFLCGWFKNAISRLVRGYPRQIVLGRGEVLVGEGERYGRIFVLIAPQKVRGELGANLAAMRYPAGRKDTVIWLDGPAGPTINALRRAEAARLKATTAVETGAVGTKGEARSETQTPTVKIGGKP
jgi:hypothetical protein